MMMSAVWAKSTSGLRSTSARSGTAARSSARTSFSEPLAARPIGVRTASTMTASGMAVSLLRRPWAPRCYDGRLRAMLALLAARAPPLAARQRRPARSSSPTSCRQASASADRASRSCSRSRCRTSSTSTTRPASAGRAALGAADRRRAELRRCDRLLRRHVLRRARAAGRSAAQSVRLARGRTGSLQAARPAARRCSPPSIEWRERGATYSIQANVSDERTQRRMFKRMANSAIRNGPR